MKRRLFPLVLAAFGALAPLLLPPLAAAQELRVLTHNSFSQPMALPQYRDLLAVENPATSSPGSAFLLATIAGLGEPASFDSLPAGTIAEKGGDWVSRRTKVALK